MSNIENKTNFEENILSSLNLLLLNIPNDLSPIEKVRWIYIKTGELFSYDYRIANDSSVAKRKIDFSSDFVGRYQTCTQISTILNLMLNNIDPKVKSKIIQRTNPTRGHYDVEHEAVEINIDNEEKYILDLTLDLYLIQSGCQTKQFGYTGDMEGTCDIIPLSECQKMDEKMGLIKYGEYTDKRISDTKSRLNAQDYSNMTDEEKLDYKINGIKYLIPKFPGYHESKQFINKLLLDILRYQYKEYNLTYRKENSVELVTCYQIMYDNDKSKWYLYNSQVGLINTEPKNIENMLHLGWKTNSKSIYDELENKEKRM